MTARTISWKDAVFSIAKPSYGKELFAEIGSVTVAPHDLIVLIGGNGSGKTSVARAFAVSLN